MPGVGSRAAFAPVKANSPPSERNFAANLADITELQRLCLIIVSVFLTKSLENQISNQMKQNNTKNTIRGGTPTSPTPGHTDYCI